MKKYLEAKIQVDESPGATEIAIAILSQLGFDSFVEEIDHVYAYCILDQKTQLDITRQIEETGLILANIKVIDDENWNANWESSYEAVIISDEIRVRAPFHEALDGIKYDIVIEPKMSFGTAHHETTALMLELILSLDLDKKRVLDMGCGTAVLAIQAFKMGAGSIMAIDNDVWAWQNALDNVQMNNASGIEVIMGDAGEIKSNRFDIIFANINRNILLKDIPVYAGALESGGKLLLSGFYGEDLLQIEEKCLSCGLRAVTSKIKNRWTAAVFTKD